MSLIAVDRIHNYYQYKDAEAKYYQLQDSQEEKKVDNQLKVCEKVALATDVNVNESAKSKKSKKTKKQSNNPPSDEIASPSQPPVVVEAHDEDISVKTDSGIDSSQATSAAAKKKSRSKKQREKKREAAKQNAVNEITAANVEVQPIEPTSQPVKTIVVENKPKDKKKKTKVAATASTDVSKNGNVESTTTSNLVTEIAKARQHIKSSLERVDGVANLNMPSELLERISSLEKENQQLHGIVDGLKNLVISLEGRLTKLEKGTGSTVAAAPVASKPAAKDDDDDDVDLFGSGDEEEDAEAERIKEERLKAYAEKKSKKPVLIAKSSILLDCKPWDDETDMKEMEKAVRTIEMDGLLWGASKLVDLAYGIKKLQIMCVIEDDKVSVDELTEKIQEFEDLVQSVDIAAFNKI